MPTLSVPATLQHLTTVNEFISANISPDFIPLVPQIELAAEELLVNVFSYAYPLMPGEAEVKCRAVNFDGVPCFCFSVRDWGPSFDPFSDAPPPDLTLDADTRPVGGLGVHLIKSVAGHYSYCRYEDSNIIELFFTLPACSPHAP